MARDIACWNFHKKGDGDKAKRIQCKNVATWFYNDNGKLFCQLCDECYEEEKQMPENQTVFDVSLFVRSTVLK